MIIVFGNQKGGAGKSTLAILYANYLTLVKKQKCIVLDMDYQTSIFNRYEEDKILDNPELYEVLELNLEKFPETIPFLKEEKNLNIIIDLPGKLDDENLLPILQNADVFIIPFCYDKLTYQATTIFNLISQQINPDAKKFFVPNRIKGNVKYETLDSVNDDFKKNGIVTSVINDSVGFQRITTKELPINLLNIVEPVFETIINNIDRWED
ncbi:ParA family protein [Flavobacterium daejeonense]|uniref:ParA family protein n=1 Tax=Flavobacterium daejeonense TaxID=350893 RepID=UPI00047C6086|nr:ParA family protein [Flavobacterium daejeonense]